MRFLRRNDSESTEAPDVEETEVQDDVKGRTAGKGRPTPKRREAEGRKRGPVPPPPRTTREAMKRARTTTSKEDRRKASAERRERMMAGDDRYLLPRDRGPIKAYVRDVVDSRRNLLGLFMPLAIVVFVSLFTPIPEVQRYASLACTFLLLAMIVEGVVLARLVTKRVRAKYPDATEKTLTLGWYSFIRASQLRRLRVPKPKVTYGEVR